jgi:hypothetical protein
MDMCTILNASIGKQVKRKRKAIVSEQVSRESIPQLAIEKSLSKKPQKKRSKKQSVVILNEIPRYQCVYTCPISKEQCFLDAIHIDNIAGNAAFCKQHVLVCENLMQMIQEMVESGDYFWENMYKDLRRIQLLDSELIDGDIYQMIENGERLKFICMDTEIQFSKIKERYILACKHGLGTHSDIVEIISSSFCSN